MTTAVVPSASASSPTAASPGDNSLWSSAVTTQAAAVLSDTTGQYSEQQQLDAYNTVTNLITSGAAGGGGARAAVVNAWQNSAIMQKVSQVTNAFGAAGVAAHGSSGTVGVQQQISMFNSLSADDQQIIVNQYNNASSGSGTSAFASTGSFKANLQAQSDYQTAVQNALSSGAFKTGQDISTVSDPKLAAVLSLGQGNRNSDAWTSQMESALSALNQEPAVQVTLSAGAQATLAAQKTSPNGTSSMTEGDVALATLKAGSANSAASAALKMLKSASTGQANVEAGAKAAQNSSKLGYQPGANLDKNA